MPDADACRAAAEALMAKFPGPEAAICFATLLAQEPDTWRPLEDLVTE